MRSAILALFAVGCSAGADGPPAQIGAVDGSQALVALFAGPSTIVGYVCDSASIWGWLDTALSGGRFDSALSTGVIRASGQVAASGEVTGSLSFTDGSSRSFHTTRSPGGGLYRAEQTVDGHDFVGGWILLGDGQQQGGVNAPDQSSLNIQVIPNGEPPPETAGVPANKTDDGGMATNGNFCDTCLIAVKLDPATHISTVGSLGSFFAQPIRGATLKR